MSTLAVVVDWTGPAAPAGPAALTARRMLDSLRDRAPDGIATVSAPGAVLGLGKLVVAHKQGHGPQPLVDAEASLYLVADVRIDNREDLKVELGLARETTDAEIVLAGYRKWGPHVPEHLIGDFAFAVWDARERTLFAARDPFGVRPLVYRRTGAGTLLLASDVEQILAVDETAWLVDDETVVDYLSDNWRSSERTFFAAIKVLPGGHYLLARDDNRCDVARWWRPSAPPEVTDHGECFSEFRRLLSLAVADRLESEHPVLMQVSGGFDSPSIALTASRVGARVPLRAISAAHPGLDCDERQYVEALAPRLSFPVEYWNGTQVVLPDLQDPSLSGPGRRSAFTNGSRGGLDIAEREGARVILSGSGGDVWQPSWPSLADYLHARRWRQFIELGFLHPDLSWRSRFRLLRANVRRFTPDPVARRLTFWRWDRRLPPVHLTAEARDWLKGAATPDFDGTLPGAGNRARLRELCQPRNQYVIDIQQTCTARARAELRFPFLDTRLLTLLWGLPLTIWQVPGYRGRFHAWALRDQLPPEITLRKRKTLFMSAARHRDSLARSSIDAVLNDGVGWRCNRYVDERAARALQATDGRLAWSLATLEAWLKVVYVASGPRASLGERTNAFPR